MRYLPVLGPEGWVADPAKKLDAAMSHLYASDASQTHFFFGEVASMAKVVKENQGNLAFARDEVQEMLEKYFSRYFNIVEVSVYIYDKNDSTVQGELVLSAQLTDDNGEIVQLHEVMTKKGSLTRQFLDYQEKEPQ